MLSPSRPCRDAKLNTATTVRYLSLLEASFILYRLYPSIKNRASRLIKSPKPDVTDSGLTCYPAGIDDLETGPYIEAKAGTRWENKDLSGRRSFLASSPHCVAGILVYNGTEAVKIDDKLWKIPISTVLS